MKYRNKKRYGFLILLLIAGIGIGYALLSTTLNITGQTSIGKSSWNVQFENIQIKDGSVEAVKDVNGNFMTSLDFEVDLNLPGDFYEFTVDVVNGGTIDAMIDSIEKTPGLTEEQNKYFNYTVEYQNGEAITSKQLVKSLSFVRLVVRVEYKDDLTASDLPTEDETLNLGFTVNYIQSDGTGSEVTTNGVSNKAPFRMVSGDLETSGSEFCLGEECFYVIGEYDDDMVIVLSKYNLDVGNKITYLNIQTGEYQLEPIENPTGIQSPLAVGADIKEYKLPFYGMVAFSKSGAKYFYDSDIKVYVDNYADYIHNLGYPSYLYTIPFKSIIDEYVCGSSDGTCNYSDYPWLCSTSYWLDDYDEEDGTIVIMMNTGSLGYTNADVEGAGVRPGFVFRKGVLTN